jgi:molybdate transport system substrate-binding protein
VNRARSLRRAVAALAAAALAAAAPAAADARLRVYAAASLREAFPALEPHQRYNFAGSNQLQLQIERGAPADVFASASVAEAQALFRKGLCGRPQTFATNVLVIITPRRNPGHVNSIFDLRGGPVRRLAVGTAGVPVGSYTRQLLRRMDLMTILSHNRVSSEPNVASITSKVALGSADAGFVYATDWRAVRDRTQKFAIPRSAQPPVRYQLCTVRRRGVDTRDAARFIGHVLSGGGRSVLRRYGFGLPPRGR